MFFWKKKRADRQAERLVVTEELVGLHLARNTVTAQKPASRKRLYDPWARGYMWGVSIAPFRR